MVADSIQASATPSQHGEWDSRQRIQPRTGTPAVCLGPGNILGPCGRDHGRIGGDDIVQREPRVPDDRESVLEEVSEAVPDTYPCVLRGRGIPGHGGREQLKDGLGNAVMLSLNGHSILVDR